MNAAPRAGLVSRLGAFVVDAMILAVTVRTTAWLFASAARALGRFAPPLDMRAILLAAVPLLVGIYQVAFWVTLGQTPGKRLMGIKIVAQGGDRVRLGRALVRLFGYLISALPCYLGFLWMLGPERRGWHDILAGTEVVYVPRREPAQSQAAQVRRRLREQGMNLAR